jgi:heme O synthase-like polyprenyltransferase
MKYGNEYVKAGIPSVNQLLSHSLISRITFLTTAATIVIAIFLGIKVFYTKGIFLVAVAASLFLIVRFSGLLRQKVNGNNYRKYFNSLDAYFLLIMWLMIMERMLPPTH